jgi:predicted nucleotidyltransferase
MKITDKGPDIPFEKIEAFCRKWKVTELSLFGSSLREDFGPGNDIDLLVTFSPETRHTLLDLVAMEDELKQIFGREVDLVDRRAIEKSENYIRRRNILSLTKVIYAA